MLPRSASSKYKVFVGFNTKQMLKKLLNDVSIDQNEYDKVLKQWLFTKKV